eukprot:3917182-Karenia_brevis.AAC.1
MPITVQWKSKRAAKMGIDKSATVAAMERNFRPVDEEIWNARGLVVHNSTKRKLKLREALGLLHSNVVTLLKEVHGNRVAFDRAFHALERTHLIFYSAGSTRGCGGIAVGVKLDFSSPLGVAEQKVFVTGRVQRV